MNKAKVTANLTGNMGFKMDLNGHTLITDGAPEIGGENLGPRPKQLLLSGLIGCTGIDVMMILKKMRVTAVEDVIISAEADLTDGEPQVYSSIHLVFTFKGKDLPMDKITRAVTLSQEKYCGVSTMLEKAMPITYEIRTEE